MGCETGRPPTATREPSPSSPHSATAEPAATWADSPSPDAARPRCTRAAHQRDRGPSDHPGVSEAGWLTSWAKRFVTAAFSPRVLPLPPLHRPAPSRPGLSSRLRARRARRLALWALFERARVTVNEMYGRHQTSGIGRGCLPPTQLTKLPLHQRLAAQALIAAVRPFASARRGETPTGVQALQAVLKHEVMEYGAAISST